jgi:hypothetical protein
MMVDFPEPELPTIAEQLFSGIFKEKFVRIGASGRDG